MASTVKTVLKLHDQFSAPMKNCANSCKIFNANSKVTDRDVKRLATSFKTNLVRGVKVGTTALISAGSAIVGIGMKYNTQMQDYMANFKVMLGSEEAAAKKVNELKKISSATPFEMSDLADATKTLLAFGIRNKDTTRILKMMGDVSLGNAEKMSSLARAYGKASSEGKLSGETLQSMIDAGFNPLNIIAKKTGENMTDLKKRMSDGKVTIKELEDAFETATSKGGQFYGGMKEGSKTFNGQISTIKDNLNSLAGEIAGPLTDALTKKGLPWAIEKIGEVQNNLPEIKAKLKSLGNAFSWLTPILAGTVAAITAFKVIKSISTAIQVWKAVTTAYAVAQGLANASMLACPLTWVVIGVGAVIAVITLLVLKGKTLSKWLGVLKKKFLGLSCVQKVISWVKALKSVFDKVLSPIKKVAGWLGKVFEYDGKTVDVNVNKNDNPEPNDKGDNPKPRKRNATGTSYFSGGLTRINEGGRTESAILPSGTQIIPADKTQKALNNAAKRNVTVYVTVQGNMIGNEKAMEEFAEYTGKKILTAMDNV